MKIFENKKLFGKINILDIIIIFVIFAIGIILISVFGKKDIITNTQYKKLSYEVEIRNLPKDTNTKINVGDKIYDNEINAYIGKVVSVYPKEYIRIEEDYENNEFKEVNTPEKENVYIKIEVNVKETEVDFKTADDYVIKVGKPISLRGNCFAGSGYIMQIER